MRSKLRGFAARRKFPVLVAAMNEIALLPDCASVRVAFEALSVPKSRTSYSSRVLFRKLDASKLGNPNTTRCVGRITKPGESMFTNVIIARLEFSFRHSFGLNAAFLRKSRAVSYR